MLDSNDCKDSDGSNNWCCDDINYYEDSDVSTIVMIVILVMIVVHRLD